MLLLKSCLEWMKPWSQIHTVPGRKWQPTPLQYSCLGNSMDRGAWWAAHHGIKELDTTEHVHTHTHTHTHTHIYIYIYIHTVQKYTILSLYYIVSQSVRSAAQSCPTLWDPMECNMPGLPVHHQLPKFTQTHVHRVNDAIQPSHPLSSPFPAFNLSQHQGLFK